MKRICIALCILLASPLCARGVPSSIPFGTWRYRLLVNGAPIGSAVITNKLEKDHYILSVEMEIDAGTVKNKTRQIVTETTDFTPMRLEVYQTTEQDGRKSEMKTVAVYEKGTIRLDMGETKTEVQMRRPFIFEGNYILHELIRKRFKPGTIVQHYLYEPSVDVEEPILVIVKVVGPEKITVNGHPIECIRIGYTVENLKNIDEWIDERGVSVKTVITMLNNRFEMVRED